MNVLPKGVEGNIHILSQGRICISRKGNAISTNIFKLVPRRRRRANISIGRPVKIGFYNHVNLIKHVKISPFSKKLGFLRKS
jgi:hypothetical protein